MAPPRCSAAAHLQGCLSYGSVLASSCPGFPAIQGAIAVYGCPTPAILALFSTSSSFYYRSKGLSGKKILEPRCSITQVSSDACLQRCFGSILMCGTDFARV